MFFTFLTLYAVLFLITSSNALSIDSSAHLARHQQIAARHPQQIAARNPEPQLEVQPQAEVKRAAQSTRCRRRVSTSAAASSSTTIPTSSATPAAPVPSQTPPSSSSPSAGTGKVGLAWAYGDDKALANFITNKVSALYTWNPSRPQDLHGLQFAPMLWGTNQLGQFESTVKAGYANIVLGFNEPDIASQSNLDPKDAAGIWMAHGQPLRAQGYRTVTPAVAFQKPWMQTFLSSCTGCQFDFMAAHVYETDAQIVIDYLTDLHNTFGMNIWVTEFACQSFNNKPQCNEGQVYAFMTTLIAWMDSTPWIDKYFYYGLMNAQLININPLNALMNQDGTPTPLGKIYIGA